MSVGFKCVPILWKESKCVKFLIHLLHFKKIFNAYNFCMVFFFFYESDIEVTKKSEKRFQGKISWKPLTSGVELSVFCSVWSCAIRLAFPSSCDDRVLTASSCSDMTLTLASIRAFLVASCSSLSAMIRSFSSSFLFSMISFAFPALSVCVSSSPAAPSDS